MTLPRVSALTSSELVALVRTWQSDGKAPPCPACTGPALTVEDQSVRPYREWYVLKCPDCGFKHTVAVPMAAGYSSA